MSDSILSLLADELDVPPKQAKKLLIAMLREVQKRARREGVRLPEFGTFRESNGQLTFEPSPSLAREVNQRFEGLQSEDLGTAPETDTDDDEDDEGPSTITLGYQDSEWSPLDAQEADDASADEEEENDDEEPDTEEFEVPSAEETDVPAASDSDSDAGSSPDPEPDPDPDPDETSQTEELYPFVEDVPDGNGETDADQQKTSQRQEIPDEEHDTLSGIWESEEDDDEPDATSARDDEPTYIPDRESTFESTAQTESERDPAAAAEPESDPVADPSSDPHAPTSEVELDPEVQEPDPTEDGSSGTGGSTGLRVTSGLLVVLLLGGAAWYVLGQRGTVQPPRETFAQLKAQVQPHVENLSTRDIPLVGTTSQASSSSATDGSESEPSSPSDPESESEGEPSSPSETQGDATEASESPTESTTTDETSSASTDPTSTATQTSDPRAIDQDEGGWTIVVGSRTERESAQALVEKYRAVFDDRGLPVDLLPGTVEDRTRYRVGVGQFGSRSDAQSFLETTDQKLPQGAWPLGL